MERNFLNSMSKLCPDRLISLFTWTRKELSNNMSYDKLLSYIFSNIDWIVANVEQSILDTWENNDNLQQQRWKISVVKESETMYTINSYWMSTDIILRKNKDWWIDAIIRIPNEVSDYVYENVGENKLFSNPLEFFMIDINIFKETWWDIRIKLNNEKSLEELIKLINIIHFSLYLGKNVSRSSIYYYNWTWLHYEWDHKHMIKTNFTEIISWSKLMKLWLNNWYYTKQIMIKILLNYINARDTYEKERFKPSWWKRQRKRWSNSIMAINSNWLAWATTT